MPCFPLTDRDPDAILFRARDGVRTAADFLFDSRALAAALPDARWIVNGCESRYWFAVALAAGLSRGMPSLLLSDHAPASLDALARRYPGALYVSESDSHPGPFPAHRIEAPPTPAPRAAGPAVDIDAASPAAIVFTSGTTGEPVAHEKTWGSLVERTRAAADRFGFTPSRPASIAGTVPPRHMYGFETTLLLPLHASVTSWSAPLFFPEDVRQAMTASPEPRVLITTPPQLRMLLHAGLADPPERVISATAPLDTALAQAAERAWNAEVHEIYGATEAGSIASRRTTRDAGWRTYPTVTIAIEDGAAVVRTPYLGRRTLTDRIELTGPGTFQLNGRHDDMIKLGGRRASRAGLDRILNRVAGVRDGVFIVPRDLETQPNARLIAVVVAPGLTAAAILAALRQRIDPIFLPRRIILVPSLPRNDVGKLTSSALHALLADAGAT